MIIIVYKYSCTLGSCRICSISSIIFSEGSSADSGSQIVVFQVSKPVQILASGQIFNNKVYNLSSIFSIRAREFGPWNNMSQTLNASSQGFIL